MIELIFLMTAGYFIFRLWNALGTRTGFEKQPITTVAKSEADIVLEAGQFRSLDGLANHQDLPEKVKTLEQKQSGFNVEGFLEGAKKAFVTIVEAYYRRDLDTLRCLLTETLFEAFSTHPALSSKIINTVEGEIQEIDIDHNKAYITVLFRSQQNNVWIVDLWTFEKLHISENPLWLLCKTAKG